jgi:hypothetical protein
MLAAWDEKSPRCRLRLLCDLRTIAEDVVNTINFGLHFFQEKRQSVRCLPEAEALIYEEL